MAYATALDLTTLFKVILFVAIHLWISKLVLLGIFSNMGDVR